MFFVTEDDLMKLWFKFVFVVVFSNQLNCYIPLFQMIIENLEQKKIISKLHEEIVIQKSYTMTVLGVSILLLLSLYELF